MPNLLHARQNWTYKTPIDFALKGVLTHNVNPTNWNHFHMVRIHPQHYNLECLASKVSQSRSRFVKAIENFHHFS